MDKMTTPVARLASGNIVDIDLTGGIDASEARRRIAEVIGVTFLELNASALPRMRALRLAPPAQPAAPTCGRRRRRRLLAGSVAEAGKETKKPPAEEAAAPAAEQPAEAPAQKLVPPLTLMPPQLCLLVHPNR